MTLAIMPRIEVEHATNLCLGSLLICHFHRSLHFHQEIDVGGYGTGMSEQDPRRFPARRGSHPSGCCSYSSSCTIWPVFEGVEFSGAIAEFKLHLGLFRYILLNS